MKTYTLPINKLAIDGGTQVRWALNEELVEHYRDLYQHDGALPPLHAFRDLDGTDWLADGFTRLEAAKRAGRKTVDVEVEFGTLSDAQWYAAGANARHGCPLTAADRKRAILMADAAKPTSLENPTQTIAELVGCSKRRVQQVLNEARKAESTSPKEGSESQADKPANKPKPSTKPDNVQDDDEPDECSGNVGRNISHTEPEQSPSPKGVSEPAPPDDRQLALNDAAEEWAALAKAARQFRLDFRKLARGAWGHALRGNDPADPLKLDPQIDEALRFIVQQLEDWAPCKLEPRHKRGYLTAVEVRQVKEQK